MAITWNDFEKVDIRIGTITKIEDFPEARNPSYKVWVDFGEKIGIKKSSAQLTAHYAKEELIEKQVAAVVNFPPKQIASFMSEILIVGFPDENGDVVLIFPDKKVPDGGKLF
ncbi:MAG: tRNA-binding protein [Nanoarchaeota archaeon]|nr:tRNA-binding protein [Nanoarchaeota archaeon]